MYIKRLFFLQNPSVAFSQLQELEKRFFDTVAEGSVAEVRSFLEDHPDFNINAVNFQVSARVYICITSHAAATGRVANSWRYPREIDAGGDRAEAKQRDWIRVKRINRVKSISDLCRRCDIPTVVTMTNAPSTTTTTARNRRQITSRWNARFPHVATGDRRIHPLPI